MKLHTEPFRGTAAEWDAFVEGQARWTACHLYAWRPLVESLYGHETPYLCARDESGSLVGVLPLIRVRSRLFGHYLVSMPFLSYGGPLGTDDAVRALATAAVSMAERDGADLLELRSQHELAVPLPASHRKVTVTLPLTGGASSVLKALPAKVRSQTRRPFKEGMTVRFGPEVVGDFHAVFAEHMRDLGTPAQPLAFFRGIAERFADRAWFGCAYVNGVPVACGAGFQWRDEFEITWASSLRAHNRISANMGLYWAFIERAADAGLTRFNFGRCTPGSATHRFKRQWEAQDEPLWWYQRSRGELGATPSAESAKFRLATRIWQRLPIGITNAIGPQLVRYLP